VTELTAHAKINLALVVGPIRADGKHEVTTVLQRIELADRIALEPSEDLRVEGFDGDTLVRRALELVAEASDVPPRWAVRIDKRIPVAAGLGGGSSDAAAALGLANATLERPLAPKALGQIARSLGADVPFFLSPGPQLGEGDGGDLTPLELPSRPYTVLVVVPTAAAKESTGAVYAAFDERSGANGYEERRSQLFAALAAGDLAALPANDLAGSPLADDLRTEGAFRADVTGAGPAVYGLFDDRSQAEAAATRMEARGRVWVGSPAW
jgi:4-diphosphocytidyl-2-C-methyl-D-erythritol kinase